VGFWPSSAGLVLVGVLRHYSNRPDLLQQLQSAAVILLDVGRGGGVDADGEASACGVIRSRRLRDRLSPGDVQAMIELYRSGSTARQVAEKFDVSLSSVKRLLRQHGVGREGRRHH
jgi:FixJ family two-component response regulator